jgi:hypothetical protein
VGLQRSCRRGMREEEGPALGWRAHNAIVSANKTHPHAYTRAGYTISRAREGEEATLSTRLGDGDSTQSQKKASKRCLLASSGLWTTNGIPVNELAKPTLVPHTWDAHTFAVVAVRLST